MLSSSDAWDHFADAASRIEAEMIAPSLNWRLRLLALLNELERACLALPSSDGDSGESKWPSAYTGLRAEIRAAWPRLGLYHYRAPSEYSEPSLLHDSQDELASILNNVRGAIWLDRNVGREQGSMLASGTAVQIADLCSYLYRFDELSQDQK